jgi:aspartate/methionine/tyrosine aminotransferase
VFSIGKINLEILQKNAYNLRWATVPDGVIPLTAADPDYPCAPEIAEAIIKYSKDRYFSYGPAEGHVIFKESMARFFYEKRQVPATAAMVLPVDSAAFGIDIVCSAFLEKGDEAIVFDPVDFLFRYAIEKNGATAIACPINIDPTICFDINVLKTLVTPKTKMICLCNPLNPIGKVFTKLELQAIGEFAVEHNLMILSDEIWSEITFKPFDFVSIASLDVKIRERTIIVTGFSKSHGLAGLRIGVVAAFDSKQYQRIFDASFHDSTIHGSNVLSQVAATAALNQSEYWLAAFLEHLHSVRFLTVNGLNAIKGFSCHSPQGCYLAFVNIQGTGLDSASLHKQLYEVGKVAVVPGLAKWFGKGAEGHIRISFATSHEIMAEALERINNTVNQLL